MASVPKKSPLANDQRFSALKEQLSKRPSGASPSGLAAFTSNKKFGAGKAPAPRKKA